MKNINLNQNNKSNEENVIMNTNTKGEFNLENLVTVKDGVKFIETRFGTKRVCDWLVCPHVADLDIEPGALIINQNIICCNRCADKLEEIINQSGYDAKDEYMDKTFIKSIDPVLEQIMMRDDNFNLYICDHLDNPAHLVQHHFNGNPIIWWTLEDGKNIIHCPECFGDDNPAIPVNVDEKEFITRVVEPLNEVNNYVQRRTIESLQ